MNNVETRIIRHDPPRCSYGSRVTLIRVNVNTFRARNFCLTTRSAKLIAIYIYILMEHDRDYRFPIVFSNVQTFFLDVFIAGSSVSSTLDGRTYTNDCGGNDYRPLWWRHLSRKWGTKPPSRTRQNRRFRGGGTPALSQLYKANPYSI